MLNKTQRLSTGILLALIALLVVGCGADQPTATQPSASLAATTAATIASSPAPAASAATAATASDASTATSEATTSAQATPASGSAEGATPAIVAAANAFLETLDDTQRESVLFDWTDTEQKQRWSNLPQGLYERVGVMWGDLSEEQRSAWLAVMQATLSEKGYNRALAEWNADDVLAAVLIVIGILLVRSRSALERIGGASGRWGRLIPLVSAVVVTALGLGITLSGLATYLG